MADVTSEYAAANGWTEIDLTGEESRLYVYRDGATFEVEKAARLFIKNDAAGVSHRLIDASGITHRPERGWLGIRWMMAEGKPAFVA